jgi:enediyne polyketide synthase
MTVSGPAEAIAIVAMGCRYPDAPDPGRLWEMVMARRTAFRPLPRERLDLDHYRDDGPDSTYLRHAAVLDGWSFDRARFRVPGDTYRVTDLSHWLALDVAAEVLERAGFTDRPDAERERAGVVLGNSLTGEFSRSSLLRFRWPYVRTVLTESLTAEGWSGEELRRLLARLEPAFKRPFPAPTEESLVGGLANAIAGRVCNHFDLGGGGFTVDGACASSLLAVITACTALLHGDLDFALAGGVDLSLDPFELVGFARVGALAESEMRIFDARPTGFLPGEGCGVVALMRADDAIATGRTPLALIRGWGVSSDGQGGLTRPEQAGQAVALQRAYERAGFGPETVALFEGHGTGTQVGDDAELSTLIAAQGGRRRLPPAALGSVKANIGHTKAAAGVAGLIKATLALQRQIIPPTTGCEEPHELLRGAAPIRVLDEAKPWPEAPLRAAVSAMGFGGINTHLVLETSAPRRTAALTPAEVRMARTPPDHEVVLLAARSPDELAALLRRVAVRAETMSRAELTDLAATMAGLAGRGLPWRAALVARAPGQLARRARQAADLVALDDRTRPGLPGVFLGHGRTGRVGLLFPGQGVLAPEARPWRALELLFPEVASGLRQDAPQGGDLTETATAQPEILRACVAGLRWLDRLGVRATAAVGHSVGELAALHWAGAFGETEVIELASARGRIMSETGKPSTGMVSIGAEAGRVHALIAGTGLVVAADNGPSCVVAGDLDGIEEVAGRALAAGLSTHRLRVSHAFHSPAVADAAGPFGAHLEGVVVRPITGRVHSTVTGRPIGAADDVRKLLIDQITGPVLFRTAVAALALECDLLVEVGPGRHLTGLTTAITDLPCVAMDTGAASTEGVCATAAALFAAGALAHPETLFAARFHRTFDLWRDPDFLRNPCEAAPPDDVPSDEPVRLVPAVRVGGESVDRVVRETLAEALELPVDEIADADRLLSDLHLSSLRATQIAVEVIAACGRVAPAATFSLADLTVGELVSAIEELGHAGHETSAVPQGVAEWHRMLVAGPGRPVLLGDGVVDHAWQTFGDGPLRTAVEPALGRGVEPAVVVFLPENPDEVNVSELLRETRRAVTGGLPLTVVESGDAVSGYLATIIQEHPDSTVRWVRAAPGPHAPSAVTRILRTPHTGHTEIIIDRDGLARAPEYRPAGPTGRRSPPLRAGDVLLVTGGGKGLGVLTARAAAERWGVRLVLFGRARADADEVLRAGLDAMDEAGVTYRYESVDVTDPDAVRKEVAAAVAEWGPVRGVIHASGVNRPGRFTDLGPESYAEHAAVKHAGLRNVLDALDTGALRLLVTYGSVIGRFGLPGEAHYALANGRMRELVRVLAEALPNCRVCDVDWTVWSGAGMGERLDVMDLLVRSGVTPLPSARGVELLLDIAEMPAPPACVLVTGRLPGLTRHGGTAPGGYRFLDRVRTHTPGVELIAEADLSVADDPYLGDHRIDGLVVLPAVCALEAMAQAAAVLTERAVTGIADAEFERPVLIPDEGGRTVRICALTREDGDVDVVLRSGETEFAVDHFRGRATAREQEVPEVPERTPGPPAPANQGGPLYGDLFFHGPFFQRLRAYESLEATRCVAVLTSAAASARSTRNGSGTGSGSGFRGGSRHGDTLLGDAGRNDASIHVIQGCVPHRRLLPVGCDRFALHDRGRAAGELRLIAWERAHQDADYVYDAVLRDSTGRAVLSWTGLRLRDVGPLPRFTRWPAVLLDPYLQRTIPDLLPGTLLHPDGPDAPLEGEGRIHGLVIAGPAASRSAGGWTPVASVSEPEDARTGTPDETAPAETLRELTALTGEPEREARTRLWSVRKCRRRLGREGEERLTIQGAYEGGWVKLGAHKDDVITTVLSVEGEPDLVALAIMIAREP